ncbi:stage V sporulation protein E [candidate division KSB1 bacterium]|nr:MAG: stage V sporulation protein E [candidate division KSB1 bacterium]
MGYPSASTPSSQMNLEKRAGYDVWLLVIALALCVCGAIFVLTSSAAHSWRIHHGDSMAIFWNHVGRLAWGLVCMIVLAFVDYHILGKFARWIWFGAFASLIVVLILPQPPGATAHRWIYLRGFSFQPAELAKFALVNYLAMRFAAMCDDPFAFDKRKIYRGALIITFATFVFVLIEPNLSMALLVLGTSSLLFFLSGIRLKPFILVGAASAVPLGLIAWLTPYMHSRLDAFFSGILDPLKTSYHVKQSLIGIGQGGVAGLGLGASTQKHFFLPEPYKDFIFSIVGEELGLAGAVLLLFAFAMLLVRAWQISRRAPDNFGYYLGAGITLAIALSFIINVGVTLGLLPATGQPLPFISYGGSSLMMTLGAVGILLNISRQSQKRSDTADQNYLFV